MHRSAFEFVFFIFIRCFADIIKRCLEVNGDYDLILNDDEIELLSDYVELLKVFEIFTVYTQGTSYPTMNSIVLFKSEIIEK